ncbi:MAG: phosphotransferase [Ilumatobacteraceae bacterium]
MRETVLDRCKAALTGWSGLTVADVDFDDPKGFSSFTMGVRPRPAVDPPAVLYRQLAGKENAILDFDAERKTFLLLGDEGIAARCYHYDETCRIEEFYSGRTLVAADVVDPVIQRGIAGELARFHRLRPDHLPPAHFFELLFERWGELARSALAEGSRSLPPDERAMCAELAEIHSDATLERVRRLLPDRPLVFCHNDTYHGNVMLLDDGTIKLLDFEFSCLGHVAFDVANLFAETAMVHGLADPPHIDIAPPSCTDADIARLIGYYLDHAQFADSGERNADAAVLLAETKRSIVLSDYMYAMAALPLALEPIQKIRFIPYAHRRFGRFVAASDAEPG